MKITRPEQLDALPEGASDQLAQRGPWEVLHPGLTIGELTGARDEEGAK